MLGWEESQRPELWAETGVRMLAGACNGVMSHGVQTKKVPPNQQLSQGLLSLSGVGVLMPRPRPALVHE